MLKYSLKVTATVTLDIDVLADNEFKAKALVISDCYQNGVSSLFDGNIDNLEVIVK